MRQERALLDPDDARLKMKIAPAQGYGGDPNLINPSSPWPLVLSTRELELIEALSDIILPGDGISPYPSAFKIGAFFNDWLSAPYDRQQTDRSLVVDGLVWLDDRSKERYGADFICISIAQRTDIVGELSRSWKMRPFFERFRYLVIGGYFTCDDGFFIIGYRGNVPLREYPSLPDEVLDLIDDELTRLGLPHR